jgi:tetratricopeptide (TPR) repeat protein
LFSVRDLVTGTIYNNLAYLHKLIGSFQEAREMYLKAKEIRTSVSFLLFLAFSSTVFLTFLGEYSKILGEEHPETVITNHNLSECLLNLGEESEALKIKEEMIKTIEKSHGLEPGEAEKEANNASATTADTGSESNTTGREIRDHGEREQASWPKGSVTREEPIPWNMRNFAEERPSSPPPTTTAKPTGGPKPLPETYTHSPNVKAISRKKKVF